MPELPEVETIARGLNSCIRGVHILRVQVHNAHLRLPVRPRRLQRVVSGSRIIAVRRRGKYLLIDLDNDWSLLIHLGMSGGLRLVEAQVARKKHEHVVFCLQAGRDLRFCDPRRFGLIEAVRTNGHEDCIHLRHLGPEPLSGAFDAAYVYSKTRGRTVAVKNWLMNAGNVVGVGNIYANEALFRAGLDPRRRAGTLSKPQASRVVLAVTAVLSEAIEAGGTTVRDFRGAQGELGYFALALAVYGLAGEPCSRCRAKIRHVVLGGRSTYFCPRCQR